MTSLVEVAMVNSGNGKVKMSPRAKRYWFSLAASGALGGVISLFFVPRIFEVGEAVGSGQGSAAEILTAPMNSTAALIVAAMWGIILPILCVLYHQNVDEQEEHAYLWAGLLGWYAMIITIPAWYVLELGRLVPPVNVGVIFALGLLTNAAVWLWKKFR
ncbi:MAG: hypothetical protein V3V15_01365 [Sphingorhabdus sp.]